MPRLTTKHYLRTHDQLRKLWLRDPALLAELTPTEQRQLHDFFRPDKNWSDLELLMYRQQVSKDRPSLPHQAGRALTRFWEITANASLKRVRAAKQPAGKAKTRRPEDRRLTVKPLVHSEVDPAKLARAFVSLAHDLAKKRAGEQGIATEGSKPQHAIEEHKDSVS